MSTWIVGLDLRHRSDGAARFSTWLHQQSAQTLSFVGVHVIDEDTVSDLARFEGEARVRERVRAEADLVVARAAAQAAIATVEVTLEPHPADGLARARADRSAEGLIVGRKAHRGSEAFVRLGSVARRLLQRLAAPTIVVPPDLDPAALGAGPVLIAVTPAEASVGAVRFGARLAASLGRPLAFVRVVSAPEDYASIYSSGRVIDELRERRVKAAEEQTRTWLAELGHGGQFIADHSDDEAEKILAVAGDLQAPLIVCGSRMLNFVERLVAVSLSSELAARATLPVLVVPPDAR